MCIGIIDRYYKSAYIISGKRYFWSEKKKHDNSEGVRSKMTEEPNKNRASFFIGFFATLAAVSILLNVFLLIRFYYPSLWNNLQTVMIPPPVANETDHVRGSKNAKVTIIEYSDFQCPFCRRLHLSMKKLIQEENVKWIYRHYPLSSIHPLAARAAEAAECAGDQGKFWEFADALFDSQKKLRSDELLLALGTRLNLDQKNFQGCLSSGKFKSRVQAQTEEGASLLIQGTPTFFINGKRKTGDLPYSELKRLVKN
jgi:predicted DsbA family dithiol-disulfide isomerase